MMLNILIAGFHGTHSLFFLHHMMGGNAFIGIAVVVALVLWLLYRFNNRR